jgi:hypothetical protein
MGYEKVTFHKNVYTVAMAFATKIVEIKWLQLSIIGFLMKGAPIHFLYKQQGCGEEVSGIVQPRHVNTSLFHPTIHR